MLCTLLVSDSSQEKKYNLKLRNIPIYTAEKTQPSGSTMLQDSFWLSSKERTPVISKFLFSFATMKKKNRRHRQKIDHCQLEGSSCQL